MKVPTQQTFTCHSVHWGINPPPPQKHHPLFLAKPPFFSDPQNFSSLIPSHLLKVTKFLCEIFQFEFLVTAGKKIFYVTFFVIKYFRY